MVKQCKEIFVILMEFCSLNKKNLIMYFRIIYQLYEKYYITKYLTTLHTRFYNDIPLNKLLCDYR